jgi:hypothetical protein
MKSEKEYEIIRLQFDLERADNPRLYDELIGFRQGVKRVNRLRTLAHEGLMVQNLQSGSVVHPAEPTRRFETDGAHPLDEKAVGILNQIFDDPVVE